jgi:citrate lyase subunit gamma (acyl carrier protein)
MTEIVKKASAGTMESSDAYVEIEPSSAGIQLELESVVEQQFGESIRRMVQEVLQECGVENAKVRIVDRGALDCVIRSRVETAVLRGKEK